MNIIFDKKPGEIFDMFLSLWVANDYENHKESRKNFSIMKETKFEQKINSVFVKKNNDTLNIERYYYREIQPYKLFSLNSLWNNPTLDQYFEYLKNIDEYKIRKKIVKLLMEDEVDENTIEEIAYDNNSVLEYIKEKDINSNLKWEIFCVLDNNQKYVNDYIKYMKEYSVNTYKILYRERQKDMEKFNIKFEQNIRKYGLSYLEKLTHNNYIDFNKFDNIYITSSVIAGIGSYIDPKEKSLYLLIGPNIENVFNNVGGKNELEKNLAVLKSISDGTRHKILMNLVDKDYCGIEIADMLEVSGATVSQHMNFLRMTGVVCVEGRDRKLYYSINKDTIRKTIEFLDKAYKL